MTRDVYSHMHDSFLLYITHIFCVNGNYKTSNYNPGNYNPSNYNPGNYNPSNYNPGNYNPSNYNPSNYNPGNYKNIISILFIAVPVVSVVPAVPVVSAVPDSFLGYAPVAFSPSRHFLLYLVHNYLAVFQYHPRN